MAKALNLPMCYGPGRTVHSVESTYGIIYESVSMCIHVHWPVIKMQRTKYPHVRGRVSNCALFLIK
jgi:hypothetical protein